MTTDLWKIVVLFVGNWYKREFVITGEIDSSYLQETPKRISLDSQEKIVSIRLHKAIKHIYKATPSKPEN